VLFEGMILDGRNRYEACMKTMRDPVFKQYEGNDPLGYVVSLNLHRRHLSGSQRAMITAKLATLKDGQRKSAAQICAPSQQEAAKLLNVSRRSVQHARKVLDEGTPELIAAVERGEIAVSAAVNTIRNEAEGKRKSTPTLIESEQTWFLKALERSAEIFPDARKILFLKHWDGAALEQAQNYIRILVHRLDLIRSFLPEGGAE